MEIAPLPMAPNVLYALVLLERKTSSKNVQSWRCCRQSHVTVLAASFTVSDRPQRMPESHTWPILGTAERADNGRWNVDAVLTPCQRPERSEPLYRYLGAVPLRQRLVRTMTLYLMRWGTSSQCKMLCISCIKPRSNFLVPVRKWATAFITRSLFVTRLVKSLVPKDTIIRNFRTKTSTKRRYYSVANKICAVIKQRKNHFC